MSLNILASLSGGEVNIHAYQNFSLGLTQNNKQSTFSFTEVITLISITQGGSRYFPHFTDEKEAHSLSELGIMLSAFAQFSFRLSTVQ